MYFERFEGQKLERLVVDCKVPKNFVARVVLREQPIEGLPGEMLDTMTLYMAPERTISTYMDGYCYKGQEVEQKEIGVDTVTYLLKRMADMRNSIQKEMVTGGKAVNFPGSGTDEAS